VRSGSADGDGIGLVQGIIAAPNGDVWALGVEERQLLKFPGDDWHKGEILREGDCAEPCESFTAPFPLAIDQQDHTFGLGQLVPRDPVPASAPTRAEKHDAESNNSGTNIDGSGNVCVSNCNTANSHITQFCGTRTRTCPPGFKAGDQIAPKGG
jgi:hypothetical protein